jgi:hypothetical protein
MRPRRGSERLGDTDVQLLRPDAEPHPAAHGEERRLRYLVEPEKRSVEPAGVVLTPRGRCDLDVVEGGKSARS